MLSRLGRIAASFSAKSSVNSPLQETVHVRELVNSNMCFTCIYELLECVVTPHSLGAQVVSPHSLGAQVDNQHNQHMYPYPNPIVIFLISSGHRVNYMWKFIFFILISISELIRPLAKILVTRTGLKFALTQLCIFIKDNLI